MGGSHNPNAPTYVGSLERGSLSAILLGILPTPDVLTQAVIAANTKDIADPPQLPKLNYCFFVIRENRTYDEVLGDVKRANGDPALARYGMDGWVTEEAPKAASVDTSAGVHEHKAARGGKKSKGSGKSSSQHKSPGAPAAPPATAHLQITPNLHALAERFAMSDNFYVDSDVSTDGHRWLMGINPTPFFNTAWSSGYGGRRHQSSTAAQPGRRALFGGSDAPMPEDEPQFGSLWEHIVAGGKGVLNYGEGLEIEGNAEIDGTAPEGQRLLLNAPLLKPIFESIRSQVPDVQPRYPGPGAGGRVRA